MLPPSTKQRGRSPTPPTSASRRLVFPSSCPPTQATSPSVPSSNKSSTAPSNPSPSSVRSSCQLSQDTPPSTGNCSLSTPPSVTSATSSKGHPSPSRQTTCRSSTPSPRNWTLILPVNSVTCLRYPSSTAPCNMFLARKILSPTPSPGTPLPQYASASTTSSLPVYSNRILRCPPAEPPSLPFGGKTSPSTTTATLSSATSAPATFTHGSLFSFVDVSSTSSTAWHTLPLNQTTTLLKKKFIWHSISKDSKA